jgi:GlcNAc-PI de-N-acetylase
VSLGCRSLRTSGVRRLGHGAVGVKHVSLAFGMGTSHLCRPTTTVPSRRPCRGMPWRRYWPTLNAPQLERLVVVSPHPDDETLGVGGLIADSANRGVPIVILSVTDGEAASTDRTRLGSRRQRELRNAMRCLRSAVRSRGTGLLWPLGSHVTLWGPRLMRPAIAGTQPRRRVPPSSPR